MIVLRTEGGGKWLVAGRAVRIIGAQEELPLHVGRYVCWSRSISIGGLHGLSHGVD